VCERTAHRRGRARRRRTQAPRGGRRMSGTGGGAVVTCGTFDGVHRGHQAVLAEIVKRAQARGLDSLLVTFEPHPLEVVNPPVAHGELDFARRWLGRRYSVRGIVERGAGRGRTIGVPTANLAAPDPRKLLPPDGVYAVWVETQGKRHGGMMNQGPRPTFGVAA